MSEEFQPNHSSSELESKRVSRRQFIKGVALTGLAGSVGPLLAACSPAAPAPSAPAAAPTTVSAAVAKATDAPKAAAAAGGRKTVTIGMHQELEFLNVLYTQGGNSLSASKLAQRGLLFLDKDSNWIGELAAEVPTVKNGGVTPDGSKITYKLRKGVTWHDGKPVTSADVKATWDMIMNPSYAVISRFGYNQIASVDTPDESTVVLNFKQPFASWPTLFDAIIPKHIIEANTANLDKSPAMREPVGFGPFRIVQWKTSEFVEYEAFDKYWQGRPKIDRLFIRIFPSVDALLQAVEAKQVDIAWAMPTSLVPKMQELGKQGVNMITTPSANDERYVMNADAKQAPLFADKNLRKALQHAVDKKSIVDKLLYGTTVAGTSEWGGSPWENKNLPEYTYDPAKARQMLDALGWKPGPDGVRVKDGKRLSFKHATTVGNLQRENVQLMVQQMFKDVGVEMVIENKRTAELFGTFQQNGVWSQGTYEMGGWSHGLRVPDPEVSNRYLCSEIASTSNPAGAQWYRYCNPEVDKLLLEQAKEFDADKRKAQIMKIQEILHDEAYWIWLYRVPLHYTVRAEVKNFVLHPFTNFYFNPQEWDL